MTRVIVVQPEIPAYRIGFFARLSEHFGDCFSVYGSLGKLGSLSKCADIQTWEQKLGPIRRIAPGLYWQSGVLGIPIKRGDILVVWGNPRGVSNLALLLKARVKGANTIWWGHFRSSTSKNLGTLLRLRLMKLADYVLFYTDNEKYEYLKRFKNTPEGTVFALNNGIETSEIVQLRQPYQACRRADSILFLGRLTQKSQLESLFHALIYPRCSNVGLDVIGEGEEEPLLRSLAEDLGLGARIRWHGAIINEKKISVIANKCKLFVYPGAVGLSLIHGMAYGLPPIVHDNPRRHMPEVAALQPGINGLTFKENDPCSLAVSIAEALSNHALLNKMSESAVETTTRSFNTESMATRFCELITHIGTVAVVQETRSES